MLQKHEAIEAILFQLKKEPLDKNLENIILDRMPFMRAATSIYIENSDSMIEDAINKNNLTKGNYEKIHKNAFYSYSVLENNEKIDIGIFAICENNEKISLFTTLWTSLSRQTIFYPVLMEMDVSGKNCMYCDKRMPQHLKEALSKDISCYVSHIIMFSRIITCKNITYVDHEPPAKLNKKRIKQGKEPIYAYKTLEVQLNPKYRKGENTGEKLDTMPLHICQGHFKEYTAEKPLLGKFVGRYWWQPHMRGNSKNGVIEKDYIVKT